MQEAPESSTPASTSRNQPRPANLHGSRSQLDQGQTTATPIAPGSSSRVSRTVPLDIKGGYTTVPSAIDPRLLDFAEPYWVTYPQDETALQGQDDGSVPQNYGQDPIRADSASAGYLEDRATSQYFGRQNDEYSTASQEPTPPLFNGQYQPGSQTSYEVPLSSSDHYFRHRQVISQS